MYFLARQRETIARTLEPTRELDSRNVSGPLTDRRPCCRDHTLSSRSLGFMSMQVTQSLGFDAGDKKHGGLNSEHPEHTYLNMATTFLFHTLLLKSSISSSSTYRKKCLGATIVVQIWLWGPVHQIWKMAGSLWKSSFTRTLGSWLYMVLHFPQIFPL